MSTLFWIVLKNSLTFQVIKIKMNSKFYRIIMSEKKGNTTMKTIWFN